MQLFERVVSTLAAASLVITLITTYLALNRTWGVTHERSVASSISFSSYAIYLIPVSCNLLNLSLQRSWSAATEYLVNFFTSLLYMAVAIGWWVEGERKKGVWALIKQSLGAE